MNQRPSKNISADVSESILFGTSLARTYTAEWSEGQPIEIIPSREKLLERIQNFRLLDDDFMMRCFEGIKTMCESMEELTNEVVRAYSIQNARYFIELGKITLEEIAKGTQLSLKEVELLAQNIQRG